MTENKKKVNDYIIPRKEISNLLFNMGDGISTHELSMWLKSKTDDQWVVMPRLFCAMTISFFEEKAEENSGKLFFHKELVQELKELKNYL
jgi:hypothetical protein